MEQDNAPQRSVGPGRIQLAQERREFLRRTLVLGGATVATLRAGAQDLSRNLPPNVPEWQTTLGAPILEHPYGLPSRHEANVKRRESPGLTRTPQSSVSFTPLQNLFGIITPSSLHFERHHGGMPEVDPHQHRLMIHGMVANPRIFTVDDVMRFPSVSRIHFIECGANTGMEWGNVAVPTVQYTHGMIACSEWTGVLLSTLLDECGYDRQRARFVLAEGADAASLTRSVPIGQYTWIQEAKSVITSPSGGQVILDRGYHEITGLAWTGRGRVRRVDVSTDGGRNWRNAVLQEPILPKALTRFRLDWDWEGGPALLQSRVIDETGYVQPTYRQLREVRGTRSIYHNNAIQTWRVAASGEVSNVQVAS